MDHSIERCNFTVVNKIEDVKGKIFDSVNSFLLRNEKLNTVPIGVLQHIVNGLYEDEHFSVVVATNHAGSLWF